MWKFSSGKLNVTLENSFILLFSQLSNVNISRVFNFSILIGINVGFIKVSSALEFTIADNKPFSFIFVNNLILGLHLYIWKLLSSYLLRQQSYVE